MLKEAEVERWKYLFYAKGVREKEEKENVRLVKDLPEDISQYSKSDHQPDGL